MKLIKETRLPKNRKREIEALVKTCQEFDAIHLSIPLEEGTKFYLLYDNQNLLSALSLFFPEKTVCECCCFTRPDSRRNGHFSRLFEAALTDISDMESKTGLDIELYFLADARCPDTAAVLKRLEAEYEYSEYMMEYSLENALQPVSTSICLRFYGQEKNNLASPVNLRSEIREGNILCLISDAGHGKIGSFCLSFMGEKAVCFFDFQISEEFRGQGLGTRALNSALHALRQASFEKIVLQVSGDNETACLLYKKTGFQTTETLSYYYY